MTNNKALQSIINEAKQLIYRREGNYAKTVIADFEDALRASDNPHKTAYQWLQDYKKPGKRAERVEEKLQSARQPEAPKYPKREPEEWAAYKPKGNKFVEMREYSNILTASVSPKLNPKQVQNRIDRKLETLAKMANRVDSDTREHFRMALTAVLRDDQNQDIRKEAIYLLAGQFKWSEIEWTFWLHGNRRREDQYILIAAEAWCKSKYRDLASLHKAVANATRQLIAESMTR